MTQVGALKEIAEGKRFSFGLNWRKYLKTVDENSIQKSKIALLEMLKLPDLSGRTFLDIGSGSGLSSLAAYRADAERIVSFDFDPDSVACTSSIKNKLGADDKRWKVCQGSILDDKFVNTLGTFDCVYSWGVLHHTGNMAKALENASQLVSPGGSLFIAIYNDQGVASQLWLRVKQIYNRLPKILRFLFALMVITPIELRGFLVRLSRGDGLGYFKEWFATQERGMKRYYDWIDWIGGLPFEVAKPEVIFDFFCERGFQLIKMKTCAGGLGCNEFVFRRVQ